MRSRSLALLLAVATARVASAATWSIPGLANVAGRNLTHFSSDLKILNRGAAPTTATFEVVLLNSGDAPPAPVTRVIAPGETFVSVNCLRDLFGLEEKGGVVRLAADQPLLVNARTYNDANPNGGTYGSGIEAVADEELLQPDDVGHMPWVADSPDPSKGYRTNLGVFLAVPGSAADIVVFDATGQEVARQTVTGGPRAFQVGVASLVPGGVPLGRAELHVNAGKATGYLAVNDNTTGDAILVQTLLAAGNSTDVVLNGVAHSPGREGTYFQTDVRLFNAGTDITLVTVFPLGVNQPLAASKQFLLARGETREIDDILGSLFAAPDTTSGALRFTSYQPLYVLGRTSNVHQDGTPGTFGAFQTPVATGPFLGPGETATLIGLKSSTDKPGYRSNVGFLAGPDGAALRLVLRDRTGALMASQDGAVQLGPNAWSQPSLASLFPGIPVPADATLDVVPTSGGVDTFASIIDNVTGDSVVTRAAAFVPYVCAPPQIFALFADGEGLAAPGPATLTWYTDADSVSLSPGGGAGLPSYGSKALNVSQTTTFTLQATNACGSASATLRVPVGSPAVTTLSAPSAQPGQMVTLSLANVAHPEDVDSVIFSFPGAPQFTVTPYGVTPGGDLRVLVPFINDTTQPKGYFSGPCSMGVLLKGSEVAGVPFTVAPLSYSGDPVAGFRAYLDTTFTRLHAAAALARSVPGYEAAAPLAEAALADYEALLRKVASDLEAAPTAQEPVEPASPANPTPPLMTATREGLGTFLALIGNLAASGPPHAVRNEAAQLGGSCIATKIPALVPCIAAGGVGGVTAQINANVGGALSWVGAAADLAKLTTVGFILTLIDFSFNTTTVACLIYPVQLTGFDYDPTGIPALSASSDTSSHRVALQAKMQARTPVAQLGQTLENLIVDAVKSYLKAPSVKQYASTVITAIRQTFPKQRARLDQLVGQLATVLGKPNFTQSEQVGACDVPDRPIPTKRLVVYGSQEQGKDDYFLRAKWMRSAGKKEIFSVVPDIGHFLFFDDFKKKFGDRFSQGNVDFKAPLAIGRGRRQVFASVGTFFASLRPEAEGRAALAIPVPDQDLDDSTPIRLVTDGPNGTHADFQALKTGPRTYRYSGSIRGGPSQGQSSQWLAGFRYIQDVDPASPKALLNVTVRSAGSMSISDPTAIASTTFVSFYSWSTSTANDQSSWVFGFDANTLPASFSLAKSSSLGGASGGSSLFRLAGFLSVGGPSDQEQPTGQYSAQTVIDLELRDH